MPRVLPSGMTGAPLRPKGVLRLHGIGRTARSMLRPERALRDAGFATVNPTYPSRRHDLRRAGGVRVGAETADWRAGLARVHLVTHSNL